MIRSEISQVRALSDVDYSYENMAGVLDLSIIFCKAISKNSLGDFIEDLDNLSWEEYELIVEQFVERVQVLPIKSQDVFIFYLCHLSQLFNVHIDQTWSISNALFLHFALYR